jgi:hypothetical protein
MSQSLFHFVSARSKMRIRLQNHIIWKRVYKPRLPHLSRLNSCPLRPLNTVNNRSVLALVNSAINLALPAGPFDDPIATHRASCNTKLILPGEEERLLPLFLRSTSLSSPIGFLRPKVAEEILKTHQGNGQQSIWNVLRRPDDSPWAICFADHLAEFETRTQAMRVVLERWKTEGLFRDVLKGMGIICYRSVSTNPFQYIRLEQRDIPRVCASAGTS